MAMTKQRTITVAEGYIPHPRKVLGKGRIESRSGGHVLRIEPGELDLVRFEALLEQGRAAEAIGEVAKAREHLRKAIGLWQGRAFADLEYEPFASEAMERPEERRVLALEARINAELGLGGEQELVGELERLVEEHPFRERLLGQLMLSLCRAGRQADALAAYQAGRRRLAEELGLEPSPSSASWNGASSPTTPPWGQRKPGLRSRARHRSRRDGLWPRRSWLQPWPRASSRGSSWAQAGRGRRPQAGRGPEWSSSRATHSWQALRSPPPRRR
jgi:DNA-binding SARP family transcriptional activator